MNKRKPTLYPRRSPQQWLQVKQIAVARFAEGQKIAAIAAELHVSYEAVRVWYHKWQAGGSEAVVTQQPQGAKARLTQQQLAELEAALLEGPSHWGYQTELWTLERIAALIRKLFGVKYHPSHVFKVLRAMNWSCQKPTRQAKERDEAAIARWLAVDWPRIKRKARANGATVVFMDETGFSLRPNVRRSWGPRGRPPYYKEHFNWKKLSAAGAIAWRPGQADTRFLLSVRPGSFKSPEIIEFLRNLRRHIRGKVVLVWDGLPCHRASDTQKHIADQADWLTVERFPAYAPELNPLEYLWTTLKAKDLANYTPDTIAELADHVERGMGRVRRRDLIGLGFIKHASLMSKREYLRLCKGQ
jgi:transposase